MGKGFLRNCLWIFILGAGGLGAQTPGTLRFDHLGTAQGLSNSSVSSIVQDQRGFLWFGTQGGLNRWDGLEFRIFDNDPYDGASLSHNLVQTLFLESEADVLWVGTYRGLNRLDLKTETITRYLSTDGDPSSLSHNVVVSIFRDQAGNLWVGTLGGLNRMNPDGKTFTRFLPNPENLQALGHPVVRALAQDGQRNFWVGTGAGLFRFNPGEGTFSWVYQKKASVMGILPQADGSLWLGVWDQGLVKLNSQGAEVQKISLPDNRVYTLKMGLGGALLAGTWGGGLSVADPRTSQVTVYKHNGEDPGSLAHDIAYSVFEDRGGILWVGTNGNGVSKYDPHKRNFQFLSHEPKNPNSLAFGKVGAILEDRQKVLWIGVNNGGVCRYDEGTKLVERYQNRPGDPTSLSNNIVNCLFEDSQGRFWVATNEGLNLFDRGTRRFTRVSKTSVPALDLPSQIIYKVFEDSLGRLWFGTYDQGIVVVDQALKTLMRLSHQSGNPKSLSNNMIYDFEQDAKGRIWVATNQGLNRFREETQDFEVYLNNSGDFSSLSSDTVRDLLVDSLGRLWIGTVAGGVCQYLPEENKFKHYTKREGLSNNSVTGILEDQEGQIYVATQGGMSILNPGTGVFRNLGSSDGLTVDEFTTGHGRRYDGSLLFGSVRGVHRFDQRFYPRNDHKPPVQITAFEVFNVPWSLPAPLHMTSEVKISYQENYFSLKFAALDFSAPEKNQYAYKLAGFDKDWIYSGTRRYASYNNLPGGDYTFLVKGANADGMWNPQPTALKIHVVPPFWETLWFRWGVPALLIALVAFAIGWRLRLAQGRNRILEEKVRRRTQELYDTNQDLKKLNATKDKFFTIMAHDLKNPFTGLLGLTDYILQEKPTQEELMSYTAEMHKALEGYYKLLENLLAWGRLQTGDLITAPRSLNLSQEIDGLVALLRPAAESKGIRLEFQGAGDLKVQADPDLLASLLQNLVFNAIKFTNSGGQVVLRAEGKDGGIQIQVSDNGIGMKSETLEKLFRPDVKVTSLGTSKERGTGLGLLLCKELATKLGGRIQVESQWQVGTTFTLWLPAPAGV